MYYRFAIQAGTSPTWRWCSDPLHSLLVAMQWLQYFHAFPRPQLRVFSADSRDTLNELLGQQNAGRDEVSVTVERFLRGGSIGSAGDTRRATEHPDPATEPCECLPPASPGALSFPMTFAGRAATTGQWMDVAQTLERRRIEVELGPGGDHNSPYRFGMPISMVERLAWVKLLARAQRGDLRAEIAGVLSAGSRRSAQHTATGTFSLPARQRCPR